MVISAEAELQRQEKSVGEQEMSLAAVTKQERAQTGRRETREGRSVVVDAEEEAVVGVDDVMAAGAGDVVLVTWAVAAPRRRGRLMSENLIVVALLLVCVVKGWFLCGRIDFKIFYLFRRGAVVQGVGPSGTLSHMEA